MSLFAYKFSAIFLLLGVIEIIVFAKWRPLFRNLSQFILTLSLPLLTGLVGFNTGYILGAIDQSLAIPEPHIGIISDADGPIANSVVYSVLALAVITIVLRFVDERRQRKTQ